MSKEPEKIVVKLDRPRALAWGDLAVYRLGTLKRPPAIADFRNLRKSYAALLGFVWAVIADGPDDFDGPEALVPYFAKPDQCDEGTRALFAMFTRDVSPSQKKSSS